MAHLQLLCEVETYGLVELVHSAAAYSPQDDPADVAKIMNSMRKNAEFDMAITNRTPEYFDAAARMAIVAKNLAWLRAVIEGLGVPLEHRTDDRTILRMIITGVCTRTSAAHALEMVTYLLDRGADINAGHRPQSSTHCRRGMRPISRSTSRSATCCSPAGPPSRWTGARRI